jgi:N,N-dimethylformamidase beta subunit-like, C-terminal
MGWYQGLGGRLLHQATGLNGTPQPAPSIDSTTGLIVCNWAKAYTLSVPTTWTSGVYLALLTNALNYQSYIIFVVRDDSRIAPLLYHQPVNTYQAYNNYPADGITGKSIYDHNSYGANTVSSNTRAVKVSFDYYRVKATIAARSSNYSNTEKINTGLTPPTELAASALGGYLVNLSWRDNSSVETAFVVERSPNGTSNWTELKPKVPANNTNDPITRYADSDVIPETTYYYRVKGTQGEDSSDYSGIANATTPNEVPPAPTKLGAKPLKPASGLLLSWTDNAANETGFVLERSTAADFLTNLVAVNLPANTTSYIDVLVLVETNYYYRVKATNGLGASAYSNVAKEKVPR